MNQNSHLNSQVIRYISIHILHHFQRIEFFGKLPFQDSVKTSPRLQEKLLEKPSSGVRLSLLQVIRKGEVSCCWICTACKENEYVQDEFTCKACDLGWWPNAELTGRKPCVSDCWPFQCARCSQCEQSACALFDVHLQRALSNTPVKGHARASYKCPVIHTERKVYLNLNENVLKGYSGGGGS